MFILLGSSEQKQNTQLEEAEAAADFVHMERNLTAAGKVTTGEKQTVSLAQGKTLKAVAVNRNEGVKKGQALVYYTDGTHTDAPSDGIVTGFRAPGNGKRVTASHTVTFSSTETLYLKVTIPENEINNLSKGDAAGIIVNAKPHKRYNGEIIDKKDISNTLMNEIKNDHDNDSSGDAGEEEADAEEEPGAEDDAEEENIAEEESEEEPENGYGEAEEEGDGETVYFSVNIRFDNDGSIVPGMSANCVITVSERDDVLAVPVEAVNFDKDGKAYVMKQSKGNHAEKTYVETGISDAFNVEIKKGIKRGDVIKYDKY